MYEHRFQPPLSRRAFFRRLAAHLGVVASILTGSLGMGMVGYMIIEGLSPPDAFLHSASLLGGMGLAEIPGSAGGKLFAGLYALYAGLVFLAIFGIMLAPVAHRLLHKFHWEDERTDRSKEPPARV